MIAALALVDTGCSSVAPRFRSSGETSRPKEKQTTPENGRRFSSREAEEERTEDDKRPAPEVVGEVVSGTKSFREEKNVAIAPLDHSKMMREISKFMGVPYLHGGQDTEGMDCSGYTMVVYKNSMKRSLPRSSSEQFRIGRNVDKAELQFGDLVFFNTTGESASHVGIYLGDDLFAHASVSLGVTVSSMQSSYYVKRYEGARRLIH
jgi:cell wall-associated NlpC family hydrolase